MKTLGIKQFYTHIQTKLICKTQLKQGQNILSQRWIRSMEESFLPSQSFCSPPSHLHFHTHTHKYNDMLRGQFESNTSWLKPGPRTHSNKPRSHHLFSCALPSLAPIFIFLTTTLPGGPEKTPRSGEENTPD